MKKSILLIAVVAAVIMSGCKKDTFDGTSISATIEDYQGSKVHLEDNYSAWDASDKVKINGYEETVNASGNYWKASLSHSQTEPYLAIFPANAATSTFAATGTAVTLPSVQTYEVDGNGVQKVNALMAAQGKTKLKFYNLCALLKVKVPANTYVNKIVVGTVENNVPLCGTGTIVFNGYNERPTLTMGTGSSTVTLNVEASRADGFFYVAIPQVSNRRLMVTVYYRTTESNVYYYSSKSVWQSSTHSISYNQIGLVDMGAFTLKRDYLPGIYTVNSSGKQVMFSRGNLKYLGGTYTTEANWEFNQNQYDYGQYNSSGNSNYFSQYTSNNGNPAVLSNHVSGNPLDWGTLFNNSNDKHWYTMSGDEWTYLLNTRTVSFHHYTFGRVQLSENNYVNGLILFPDEFTWPTNVTQPASTVVFDHTANYSNITFSVADWSWMEKAGCVFLPAGGYVNHNSTSVTGQGTNGFYRTISEVSHNNHSTSLEFSSSVLHTESLHAGVGYYVRLVYAIEALTK